MTKFTARMYKVDRKYNYTRKVKKYAEPNYNIYVDAIIHPHK